MKQIPLRGLTLTLRKHVSTTGGEGWRRPLPHASTMFPLLWSCSLLGLPFEGLGNWGLRVDGVVSMVGVPATIVPYQIYSATLYRSL